MSVVVVVMRVVLSREGPGQETKVTKSYIWPDGHTVVVPLVWDQVTWGVFSAG